MSGATRPAARDDLAGLWPKVAEARLFGTCDAFASWGEEAPWRVRVSEEGDALVLARWREHLPILAVLGLWCPQARIAALLADAADVARERGFERLLGPLAPEEAAAPHREAGLEVAQRLVVCRVRVRPSSVADAVEPLGVRIRAGVPADEDEVLVVDARCFDDFWRYDRPALRALTNPGQLTVAERDGRIIGYTLWVVHGTEATVARLGVDPDDRGRGVGRALLREAVARAARAGARAVTLTTQEENDASRRLYRREGFRESPGRLVCAISPPLQGAGDPSGKR